MTPEEYSEKYYGKTFTSNGSDRWDAVGLLAKPTVIFRNVATGQESARIIGSRHCDDMKLVEPEPDLTEKQLRDMMNSPAYWDEQEPVIVGRVRRGFRRLYGVRASADAAASVNEPPGENP
jgi:hypothetical protein